MFIVLLRFSTNKAAARELIAAHDEWIKRGLDDGVFMVVGSLQPNLGGGIVAHGLTRSELDARVGADPFVANDVVSAEVFELSPSKTDARLAFLLAGRS